MASIAVHGFLAVGIVAFLEYAPGAEVLATLDLTSVELSFAEQVVETSAVAPVLPSVPSSERPKPKSAENPPEQKIERREAPDPLAPKFPEPKEETPEMKEDVKQPPQQSDNQAIAPSVAPRQARVDAPPKPKRNIKPDYPRESRLRGEHGNITLELDVAADGSVSFVRIVSSPGYVLLEEAAVKAARAARFTPAKSGGKSVASTVRLTLDFKLR